MQNFLLCLLIGLAATGAQANHNGFSLGAGIGLRNLKADVKFTDDSANSKSNGSKVGFFGLVNLGYEYSVVGNLSLVTAFYLDFGANEAKKNSVVNKAGTPINYAFTAKQGYGYGLQLQPGYYALPELKVFLDMSFGAASLRLSRAPYDSAGNPLRKSKTVFNWGLGFGVQYFMSKEISGKLGYHYNSFQTVNIKAAGSASGATDIKDSFKLKNHNIQAIINYHF